jgi:pullulanase
MGHLEEPTGWLQSAWSTSEYTGWIALWKEWDGEDMPPLELEGLPYESVHWYRLSNMQSALLCGYTIGENDITFVLSCARLAGKVSAVNEIYVAGSFCGWSEALGNPQWQMKRGNWENESVWILSVSIETVEDGGSEFKFVTSAGEWIAPEWESPVRVEDGARNVNYRVDWSRKNFLYGFISDEPLPFSNNPTILWKEQGHHEGVPLQPGGHFFRIGNDLPLGALYEDSRTTFRLFALRATSVELAIGSSLDTKEWKRFSMEPETGGTWSVALDGDWKNAFYGYYVHGRRGSKWTQFDSNHLVLDPYALAVVGRNGPGIVLPHPDRIDQSMQYHPGAWQDLIVLEAHVADVLAKDSHRSVDTRPSFTALRQHIARQGSYLHEAPVNAIEFQPLHQNDAESPFDYHWGYMPVNYFAPHSGYSSNPLTGCAIDEFKGVVADLHARGKAVILDVVYNHYGEPNHLLYIDKLYYFRTTHDGDLYNYSGCGNDLRTEARMVRRLILDSLRYWVEVFDVDGFRFDLAELIGKPTLQEIERELKKVKPSIILIAEPWSFRGHIAGQLRDTGFSSWNDHYRETAFRYLHGEAGAGEMFHCLSGSKGNFACWPAQTINYLESHDDYTFLDRITTESDHSATFPSALDRRRIHLGIAVLCMSIGIPMFAAGIDLLRTKQGKHNTYLDGEANAMDYERWSQFSGTSQYWRDWCKWRLSYQGALLRPYHPLSEGFWRLYTTENGRSMAVLYNADYSVGVERWLFAINPDGFDAEIKVEFWDWGVCRQIADTERLCPEGLRAATVPASGGTICLPAFSCALWIGG